jgi:geranylgeranyl pyrophosphate synthase
MPDPKAARLIPAVQEDLDDDDLAPLRKWWTDTGVPATMELVDEYLARARARLDLVSDSPARRTLHRLVDFVRERDW